MVHCNSDCWLCDLPVGIDPYKGCSHGCSYCFARRFSAEIGGDVQSNGSATRLLNFINGKRNDTTSFIDWNIPVRIGSLTDPFQPIEREKKRTYEMLKVLADTQYPAVICTKGEVIADPEYLDLISKCNCLIQMSMACSSYDSMEPDAPSFERRMEILNQVSKVAKRVVIRIQPYFHNHFKEILGNLKRFKDAGAYGIIIEGMKWNSKHKGLVRVGGDFTYPISVIMKDFLQFREEAHRLGLKIYAGENRIRSLGDSLTCCGTDGMEGFIPLTYNLNHRVFDKQSMVCTDAMTQPGTARAIAGRFDSNNISTKSFREAMDGYYKMHTKSVRETFGVQ